ncbi:MAG: OmpH family outer membrane protein [Bacteroidota bacterium]
MKNLSLILNAVLFVAVAVLYYLHFSAPAQSAAPAAGGTMPGKVSTAASNGPVNIAFVNTDSLLEHYDYFSGKKAELEARSKRVEADLTNRMKNFENEVMTMRQKADANALTPAQMQEAEQRLGRRQQEIAAYKDEQTARLMDEERNINIRLNDNIRNYLKGYGKKAGFRYVLGLSSAGGILYANDSLDITTDVLKGLNEAGAEVKGEEAKK